MHKHIYNKWIFRLFCLFVLFNNILGYDANLSAQTNDKWVLEFGGRVIDDSNGQEM
jgi:hypothetical protein